MKIYYIANARMYAEMAHNIQIVKMCEALATVGNDVTLVVPDFGAQSNLFALYGVKENFTIKYLPTIELPLRLPGAFALLAFSFAVAARAWLLRQKGEAVIYTRGDTALFLAPMLSRRYSLVWETHIKPRRVARYRRVAQRAQTIVAVTKHYADEIPNLWDVPSEKVLYTPDAVDVAAFTNPEPVAATRERLGLPLDRKIVLYAGRIDSWKGVDVLLEASNLLPDTTQVVIIGGTEVQIAELRPRYPRVRFLGYRPYSELPDNQNAADVLVLTGNADSEVARLYTSPLKLFTYMASGVPIVAADLPSFHDVLTEREAFFYQPHANALAESITSVIEHSEEAAHRAERARARVQQFTWVERARAIVARIGSQRAP
jgi:glycosyltransferase involved in cell wall biosynthesis